MTQEDESPNVSEGPYWSEELLAVLVVGLGDETQARETLEGIIQQALSGRALQAISEEAGLSGRLPLGLAPMELNLLATITSPKTTFLPLPPFFVAISWPTRGREEQPPARPLVSGCPAARVALPHMRAAWQYFFPLL